MNFTKNIVNRINHINDKTSPFVYLNTIFANPKKGTKIPYLKAVKKAVFVSFIWYLLPGAIYFVSVVRSDSHTFMDVPMFFIFYVTGPLLFALLWYLPVTICWNRRASDLSQQEKS